MGRRVHGKGLEVMGIDRKEERFCRGNGFCLVKTSKPLRLGTVYVPLCISRSLGVQRECLQCFLNGRRVDSLASRVSGGEEGQR